MKRNLLEFHSCLDAARRMHGASCARLAIGTRMAMAGLKAIGVEDPKGEDRSKVLVFVEIDRCVSDAIMAVTGCRPGTRTMRILDYGKVAATFLNLAEGKAVRVSVGNWESKGRHSRDTKSVPPASPPASRSEPFMSLSDRELFRMEDVDVILRPEDMPGDMVWQTRCQRCGETVMDMKSVNRDGSILCKPCAEGTAYYASGATDRKRT